MSDPRLESLQNYHHIWDEMEEPQEEEYDPTDDMVDEMLMEKYD
jgi:hypothetical protein